MKNYRKPEQIKRRWGRTFNSNDLSHLTFRSKPTSPLVLKNASNCNYNREKQLCRYMGFSNEKLIKIWTVIIPQLACTIHLSFDWFVTEACVERNLKWKQKNFALKQLYPGSRSSLPRIIGGSDLAVHQTSERLDNDEWFVEAREVRLTSCQHCHWKRFEG